MANAFITQRIYQNGDTPQPTPTPTSSSSVKVWKAWLIGDTDFFVGIGLAIGNIGNDQLYITGAWNDSSDIQLQQEIGFLATSVWGKIESGKASKIYEYRCDYLLNTSDYLDIGIYKLPIYIPNFGECRYTNGLINNEGIYFNSDVFGGNESITVNGNIQITEYFQFSDTFLVSFNYPIILYNKNGLVRSSQRTNNILVNYPTEEEIQKFILQFCIKDIEKKASPIGIDDAIKGTLFNGLIEPDLEPESL